MVVPTQPQEHPVPTHRGEREKVRRDRSQETEGEEREKGEMRGNGKGQRQKRKINSRKVVSSQGKGGDEW